MKTFFYTLSIALMCLSAKSVEKSCSTSLKGLPAIGDDIRSEAFPYELNLVCSNFGIKYIFYSVFPVIEGPRKSLHITRDTKFEKVLKILLKNSNMRYVVLNKTLVVYDKAYDNQRSIMNILDAKLTVLGRSHKSGVVTAFQKKDGKYFDLPECDEVNKILKTMKNGETVLAGIKNHLETLPNIQGCEFNNSKFRILRKEKPFNAKKLVKDISSFKEVEYEYTLKGPSYSPVLDFWLPYFLKFNSLGFVAAMRNDGKWLDSDKGTYKPIREIIWDALYGSKNKIIINFLINSYLKCEDASFMAFLLKNGEMPKINGKLYRFEEIKTKCVESGNKQLRNYFIKPPAFIPQNHQWPIKAWAGFDHKGSTYPAKKLIFNGESEFPYVFCGKTLATCAINKKLKKTIRVYKYEPPFSIASMIPDKSLNVSSTPELAALSLFSKSKYKPLWNAIQKCEQSEYFVLLYRIDLKADNMNTVVMLGYAPIYNNEFYSFILYRDGDKWHELLEFSQEGKHPEASIVDDDIDINAVDIGKKIEKSIIIKKISEKISLIIHNKLPKRMDDDDDEPIDDNCFK